MPLLTYNYTSGSWSKDGKTQLYIIAQYIENYEEIIGGSNATSGVSDVINRRQALAQASEAGKRESGELVVQIFPEKLGLEAGVKKYNLAENPEAFKVWIKHENDYFHNNQPISKEIVNWQAVSGSILVAVNKPELLYSENVELDLYQDESIFGTPQNDAGNLVVNLGFEYLVLSSKEFKDGKERFVGSERLLLPATTVAYAKEK